MHTEFASCQRLHFSFSFRFLFNLYFSLFKFVSGWLLTFCSTYQFSCSQWLFIHFLYICLLSLDFVVDRWSTCNNVYFVHNTHHLWSYASHQIEKQLKAFNAICIIIIVIEQQIRNWKLLRGSNSIDLFSINFSWMLFSTLLTSSHSNRIYGT